MSSGKHKSCWHIEEHRFIKLKNSLALNFETFAGYALAFLCFIPRCFFTSREDTHFLPQTSHLNIPFTSISPSFITESIFQPESSNILPPAVHTNLLNLFQPRNHCLLWTFSQNVFASSVGRYSDFKFMAWNNRKQPCFQTIPCSSWIFPLLRLVKHIQ